ncbi:hypothetical protein BC834DRAFT_641763 [Gloeopeniophorella convolvens]|nr:hypothetical protein BC834DRAFT_641763 [Gloeopeniophorella convolvens]
MVPRQRSAARERFRVRSRTLFTIARTKRAAAALNHRASLERVGALRGNEEHLTVRGTGPSSLRIDESTVARGISHRGQAKVSTTAKSSAGTGVIQRQIGKTDHIPGSATTQDACFGRPHITNVRTLVDDAVEGHPRVAQCIIRRARKHPLRHEQPCTGCAARPSPRGCMS